MLALLAGCASTGGIPEDREAAFTYAVARQRADEPALAREVALLADKTDVTEELDRLGSHLVAVRETLASDGAVGLQLDFLLQEVGREVNTVGSKCSDVEITRSVVSMKACVERLREQAANVA